MLDLYERLYEYYCPPVMHDVRDALEQINQTAERDTDLRAFLIHLYDLLDIML